MAPQPWKKECYAFDKLWNKPLRQYNVPSGSYCSDFLCITGLKPYWFECNRLILPKVRFRYGDEKNCTVETSQGKNNPVNHDCIKDVARFLKKANDKYSNTKLIYITHGWQGSGRYLYGMMGALFSRYSRNNTVVGMVFWPFGAGADSSNRFSRNKKEYRGSSRSWLGDAVEKSAICCFGYVYGEPAANVWPIGNVLGYLHEAIAFSEISFKTDTYCIGYSLGAHLCGFFGKMLKELLKEDYILKKIIGLDPAGPLFDQTSQHSSNRLDKSDANVVEIFHTNAEALGFTDPLGDVDFYLNGGYFQPFCTHRTNCPPIINVVNPVCIIYDIIAPWASNIKCSHNYAFGLMIKLLREDTPCYLKRRDNVVNRRQVVSYKNHMTPITKPGCIENRIVYYLGSLLDNVNVLTGRHDVNTNQKDKDDEIDNCKLHDSRISIYYTNLVYVLKKLSIKCLKQL